MLLGKFHGQRSLEGCSPWGRKESEATGWLSTQARLNEEMLGSFAVLVCLDQRLRRVETGELMARRF